MGYFFFHHLVTLVLVAVAQFAKRLHLTVKKWCNMLHFGPWDGASVTVWPDWVIFCCLDDFLKPVATTFFSPNWPYYWAILKKCHFSSESIFGQLFIDIGQLLTQAFWSPWLWWRHKDDEFVTLCRRPFSLVSQFIRWFVRSFFPPLCSFMVWCCL